MVKIIALILFISLAACANDKQTGSACGPFQGAIPKYLILTVGHPRADGMSIQFCSPNCYVATDSQGEVQWCEK